MATMDGVYSASVVDNRDPDGLGRVRVRVSALGDIGARGVWARVATMMAGRNRGTFFLPEVGDEVLVAFEAGDQRAPYVLGALWNVKSPPPEKGDPAAGKLIQSRTGVTLRIRDDDTTSSLVIETPGGERITLQDGPASVRVEDANGNSVVMDTSGVTVTASSRVTLTASSVTVNAGALDVNAVMSHFTGVVQCDTMISNSVISASYSPGAGNLW
jgi:uncharacterized protein involved in type VI secretion and phage assembly